MKELTVALLAWVVAQTGYVMPDAVPRVVRTDIENLIYLALGEVPIIPQRARVALMGVYDPHTRTVWMRDDLDLEGRRGRALVVHELVHYLQHVQPRRAPPRDAMEAEARRLERAYFETARDPHPRDASPNARGGNRIPLMQSRSRWLAPEHDPWPA